MNEIERFGDLRDESKIERDSPEKEIEREKELRQIDKAIDTVERMQQREESRTTSLEIEREREALTIPKDKVEYMGLIITERGLDNIRQTLERDGISLVGREQANMHMTCEYFGFKPTADREPVFADKDLGKTVIIRATGFGDLRDDQGRVLNQGLRIDSSSLDQIRLSDGRNLLGATKNEIPHITLSINPERNEDGRPIARAVDTAKCDFRPHKAIEIECRVAVFSRGQVAYKVERQEEERKEERQVELPKEKPIPDRELERIEVSQGALTVIDVLHNAGYNADLVGGCVRDAMLGVKPKDEDITTNLEPDRVVDLFEREGFRVVPTGLQHGTVTIMVPDEKGRLEGYEVTAYRVDGKSTDQRHPDSVTFVGDIREDMARRDFTINAMAFDPRATGEDRIKDFYGGREDLKNGVIRAVGDPTDRIKEDALRMVRAVRFAAQKDMQIEPGLRDAIRDRSQDIERVSKERINAELSKILVSDNARQGIADLRDTGLLRHIAPPLDRLYDTPQNNPWHLYDAGRHTERVVKNVPPDKITRTAALFHDLGKGETRTTDSKGIDHFYGHPARSEEIAKDLMRDLKFTADETRNVCLLIRYHDDRLEPDREKICSFIERHQDISRENFHRLIDLQKADMLAQNPERTGDAEAKMERVREIYEDIVRGPYRTSDLAMDGRDIQRVQEDQRGSTTILYGQDIKVAKERMLGLVLREPEKNNQSDLQSYLRSNLRDIKNASITRMPEDRQRQEREFFKQRTALEKVQREIKKLDTDQLRQDRDTFTRTGDKSKLLERAESLTQRREELMQSLRDGHSQATPRLSEQELKEQREEREREQREEEYKKAVERYCQETGLSVSDYQSHEFYADKGWRDHLPPEKLNPDKK